MQKVSLILVLAVLLPSGVLAFLAVRSLDDQQIVLERQQGLLYQEFVDNVAQQIDRFMASLQNEFTEEVDSMLTRKDRSVELHRFNAAIRRFWPLAKVGFVVSKNGELISPAQPVDEVERNFLSSNRDFFENTIQMPVYNRPRTFQMVAQKTSKGKSSQVMRRVIRQSRPAAPAPPRPQVELRDLRDQVVQAKQKTDLTILSKKGPVAGDVQVAFPPEKKLLAVQEVAAGPPKPVPGVPPQVNEGALAFKPNTPSGAKRKEKKETSRIRRAIRKVVPSQNFDAAQSAVSKAQPEVATFRTIVGNQRQGGYARFHRNQLSVFFWYRPASMDNLVFGVELEPQELREQLASVLEGVVDQERWGQVAVALLDDAVKPVCVTPPNFEADWRRPFVSSEEIGPILPHWEVAAYLMDPSQLQRAASHLRWTLGSVIGLMFFAVALGGCLLWRDIRREMVLARQKTDFVSNVSHELKTPLTSIRMFSELLRDGGPESKDSGRSRRYLDIIIAEASRLTRLINNILDFSRLEESRQTFDMKPADLGGLAEEVVETYRAHLEQNKYQIDLEIEARPAVILADPDAIKQIILNLLSNAEKYGGDAKEIRVEVASSAATGSFELRVLDRGSGVPRGHERQIFKKFYRAHDSLGSGIQGSGLGLTLGAKIAEAHGGALSYRHRPGGGACFVLTLPASKEETES